MGLEGIYYSMASKLAFRNKTKDGRNYEINILAGWMR